MEEIYCLITRQMNANPEPAMVVAGDFNHMELKGVFPTFHRFINIPTRDKNILDQAYSHIPGAYKAIVVHQGMSDHISVELIRAYKPLICRTRPTTRTVKVWTYKASSPLQDCSEHTDQEVCQEGVDLEDYTSAVLDYVRFCTDAILPTKSIRVFPNQKPWIDSTVPLRLKARDAVYRSEDWMAYSRVRKKLKKGIQLAKHRYRQRINKHFVLPAFPSRSKVLFDGKA